MLKARLTEDPDGCLCLESVYHGDLVAWLRTLPSGSRTWDPERRKWLISMMYAAEVVQALQQFQFEVQDDRASVALARSGDEVALWSPVGMPRDLAEALHSLGLNGSAPLELAVVAHRFWMKYYHPDINGTGDEEAAKALNNAIKVVRDYLGQEEEAVEDS